MDLAAVGLGYRVHNLYNVSTSPQIGFTSANSCMFDQQNRIR